MPLRFPPSVLALALCSMVGCGGGKGGGKSSKSSGDKGKPIPLKVAATVDTQELVPRLRFLLGRHRPALILQDARPRAAQAGVARGRIHLLLDSHPSPGKSRPPEAAVPQVRILGAETVAVLTNATNPIDRLSLDDLQRILRGEVDNWKHVRGPRLPLVAYTLAVKSDLSALLRRRFTRGKPFVPSIRRVANVATLLESVRRTPGAVGLLASYQIPRPPVGKLTPPGIKMLALSSKIGAPAYLATDRAAAIKGHYPLLLPVVLLVGVHKGHRARTGLDKLLRPKMIQHLSVQLGLIPLPPKQRAATKKAWDRWLK